MTVVDDHYDRLLAEHYTWMLGGDLERVADNQVELLRSLGMAAGPGDTATAVDLGCGPGPQALALARLGYTSVTAIDTSAALLDELAETAERLGCESIVQPIRRDLRGALPDLATAGSLAAVVCMGDTLPHLPTRADVVELIADVAEALRPGGSFVVTYRDQTLALPVSDRFIPVRSTADQILTCYLDYVDEDTVLVHDLLHVRRGDNWYLTAGSYPKLRLSYRWLSEQCQAVGLDVHHEDNGPCGMKVLHAVKP
ncbi:class I SAM-dependent methyltransferase [Nocardia sp. NPDC046763]|uniref:class I SAM-dependent methyltransferase n=1 Tax=Nocardia sp. NPDC046763 TaxID=3155256 RepID=UPI0033E70A75